MVYWLATLYNFLYNDPFEFFDIWWERKVLTVRGIEGCFDGLNLLVTFEIWSTLRKYLIEMFLLIKVIIHYCILINSFGCFLRLISKNCNF